MALERQVKCSIEQRMTWTDEGGERLALRCDQRFLKGDALVARQHRFTRSDHAVAVAHRRRDMGDFIPARLALPRCAAKLSECFQEERLDVVRLQSARFCALHILPNAG